MSALPIAETIARADARQKGNDLIFRRGVVASIVPDSKWPQMWRVSLPNGELSDMVNLSRARDAARSLALKALIKGPVAAPPKPTTIAQTSSCD